MNSLKCIFQAFTFREELEFRRDCLSNTYFCRMSLMVVMVFCVRCELATRNLVALSISSFDFFSQFLLNHAITTVLNNRRRPVTLIMLLCSVMGTSLPCDYAVISFFTIITPDMNKS